MVKENYAYAYKEVIELLKYFSLEDVEKIPEDLIKVFLFNMDTEYVYKVDEEKTFEEQTMLEETKVIFAIIFRDYWATDYQRERILAKEENDKKRIEEEKSRKYNTNNIFKEKVNKSVYENLPTIIEENSFFKNIINKIINIFKKSK